MKTLNIFEQLECRVNVSRQLSDIAISQHYKSRFNDFNPFMTEAVII